MVPETWLPTWTVLTGVKVPVAETTAAMGPRRSGTVPWEASAGTSAVSRSSQRPSEGAGQEQGGDQEQASGFTHRMFGIPEEQAGGRCTRLWQSNDADSHTLGAVGS